MAEFIDREELKKAVDTWDRFYYVPLQGVKRGSNDDYTALVRIDDILHCIDNMPYYVKGEISTTLVVKDGEQYDT